MRRRIADFSEIDTGHGDSEFFSVLRASYLCEGQSLGLDIMKLVCRCA